MSSGLPRTAVPSTIHCDHLIEVRSRPCVRRARVRVAVATTAAGGNYRSAAGGGARAGGALAWRAQPRRSGRVQPRARGVAPAARGRRERTPKKRARTWATEKRALDPKP
jgi:hypothetical protein